MKSIENMVSLLTTYLLRREKTIWGRKNTDDTHDQTHRILREKLK